MIRFILLTGIWISLAGMAHAQIGGTTVFSFLELPANSRLSALGGMNNGVQDNDPSLNWSNPASSNIKGNGGLSFSQAYVFQDISHGSVIYQGHIKKGDFNLHGGIRYINYGDFQGMDEFGFNTSIFEGSEQALMIGASKQLYERLTVGLNVLYVNSALESYTSSGVSSDWGLLYEIAEKRISYAFVIRNLGVHTGSNFTDRRGKLPTDVQFTLTKRLEYLPFRFSVSYHHLNRWDLLYYDEGLEPDILIIGGDEELPEPNLVLDNFLRHFSLNGELLIGKTEGMRLQFGYNHQRQREMQLNNWSTLSGLSLGLELKVKRFRLGYARGRYHLAGGTNHISIATNINRFGKNKLLQ